MRRTVLYVEDDELSRELMTHLAALVPGCRLVTASSLDEARTALADEGVGGPDHDVALVMADLDLPDGDGTDLFEALRDAPAPPAMWVITGDALPTTAERIRAAGADAVVIKPFEVAALVARLADVVGDPSPT